MADAAVDAANIAAENYGDVVEWLRAFAGERQITAKFYTNAIKRDQNWLYIPVYVEGADSAIKARVLQQFEDAWRDQEPEPYWQLLLIPTAN